MKILSAEFIRSCYKSEQFPRDRRPEVAFVGRSNVGKSTLINSLLNRKQLAKVSRTPGKTQAINFFKVKAEGLPSSGFYLVDLPGYGYAKVAKSLRVQWEPLLDQYLIERPTLCGIFLLLDARGVRNQDHMTMEWLRKTQRPLQVIVTKMDKISRSDRLGNIQEIREHLKLPTQAEIISYSSVTHDGRDNLWKSLRDIVMSKG